MDIPVETDREVAKPVLAAIETALADDRHSDLLHKKLKWVKKIITRVLED